MSKDRFRQLPKTNQAGRSTLKRSRQRGTISHSKNWHLFWIFCEPNRRNEKIRKGTPGVPRKRKNLHKEV
ncbi:hypothetical protein TNCV_4514881 [Trichonephila clavipes]|nr:hypothetical protein TNCV_4514881 [Trichonephila clavipes]